MGGQKSTEKERRGRSTVLGLHRHIVVGAWFPEMQIARIYYVTKAQIAFLHHNDFAVNVLVD
jgi:hypothetical protein